MKSNKNKLNLIVATFIALLCAITAGCATRMTPQVAQSLTTLAVYEYAKDNPKGARFMRSVQPLACSIATRQGVTLEDVLGEVQNAGGFDAETAIGINLLLTIFQASTATTTNAAAQYPYFQAVFCDGWETGLALVPTTRGINAPPASLEGKRWILAR